MDEIKKKAKAEKVVTQPERLTLSPMNSQKMNAWLNQLNEKFKGLIEINRSDLANYFLALQPDVLNRDQVEKIKTAYYDEVRFMSWALQKMKESKKNGEPLTLKDLMALSATKTGDDVKRTKKAKGTESTALDQEIESTEHKNVPLTSPAKPYLA